MLWGLKYGKDFEHIVEAYEMFKNLPGYHVPTAIAEKPNIDNFDAYYLNAFNTLSSSRSIGMSEGYIPLSEIIGYGLFLGDDDMDKFIQIVRQLDSAYVEQRSKDNDKKT